jgi:hypothetical protein
MYQDIFGIASSRHQWHIVLLSMGGRLVLRNTVLDALPSFVMGVLALPAGVLVALNRLRRTFLWAAGDKVSGAQCLITWDCVCRGEEEAGMGMQSLPD